MRAADCSVFAFRFHTRLQSTLQQVFLTFQTESVYQDEPRVSVWLWRRRSTTITASLECDSSMNHPRARAGYRVKLKGRYWQRSSPFCAEVNVFYVGSL